MSVSASGGSPLIIPQTYRTVPISTIVQAEQQDRFLQLGELNELVVFLNSGLKRLKIADFLAKNATILVSKAADKIFVGGLPIAYLERPQAAFLVESDFPQIMSQKLAGDTQKDLLEGLKSAFKSGEGIPPGFKPINVARYGSDRMKKSMRDLDWFLRYLTYAIIAGDPNILTVNIRGLRDMIENACSSAAAIVALREMRKQAIQMIVDDLESQSIIRQYFNVLISEFEASSLTDKLKKRSNLNLQGLCLPQAYSKAGVPVKRFVMNSSLSTDEKNRVIKACYRQIFERDIVKAYSLSLSDLESQVKNGKISIKEFVRAIGKSCLYRKNFYEPFVNSRALELAFRHFLGRGLSSLEEFRKYFSILSSRGWDGLIDGIVNSLEYADYFGEETVPYFRALREEAQECSNWGPQIELLSYSAPFRKIPQFLTLFGDYRKNLPDQHPYGLSNDPLPLQFGAIFPNNRVGLRRKSAPFGKDARRILISRSPGIYNQISNPSARSKFSSASVRKVFNLTSNQTSLKVLNSVIRATYLRVFGRPVYQEEIVLLQKGESQLRDAKISVRDFVRYLAKSNVFKSLYWQPFYLCKAIEYIHNRLLGRPTYGRQEINQYFDIVYKQGFNAFIDAIIDSAEYLEVFGNSVVPYERYFTPLGLPLRLRSLSITQSCSLMISNTTKFIKLSQSSKSVSSFLISKKITQGVTPARSQNIIFQASSYSDKNYLEQVLRAAYRQIFERDISILKTDFEFVSTEQAFLSGTINVKELILRLGLSRLYGKEFYQPYPNTKVIELSTKHFLGRAPKNQAEIRLYNQVLASQGLSAFILMLVSTHEYQALFGTDTVPYRRFPTLPAANFPNTVKLHSLTKQTSLIVVPSFKSAD